MERSEAVTNGQSDGPWGNLFAIIIIFAVLFAHLFVPFGRDGFALRRGKLRVYQAIHRHTPAARLRGKDMNPTGITQRLFQQWTLV